MTPIDATRAILADGWKLSAAEAAQLESDLERDPENVSARIRLLSYYTQFLLTEPRTKHLLWLIENHPVGRQLLLRARQLDPKNPRWQAIRQ